MSLRDKRKLQTRQALLDAALSLSTQGRSFANVSLREVAREAGLVPTAFYRHFQDMDELGAELVNQCAISLHFLIKSIKESYSVDNILKSRDSVSHFFGAVSENPLHWSFMISERWGGSPKVCALIANEIDFFQNTLAHYMENLPEYKQIEVSDLIIMTEIMINLSFSWGMTWLNLPNINSQLTLPEQQEQLIAHASRQVQLLFKGVSNWRSNKEIK